jgi:hypothetical protein
MQAVSATLETRPIGRSKKRPPFVGISFAMSWVLMLGNLDPAVA